MSAYAYTRAGADASAEYDVHILFGKGGFFVMLTRIITAVAALAVLVGVLVAPPIVFTAALALVILIMLHECYGAIKTDKAVRAVGFVTALLIMAVGVYYRERPQMILIQGFYTIVPILVISIAAHMILVVFKHGKQRFSEILAGGFVMFYVVISMGCLWLAKSWFGTANMILIFICAWSTDTFAYFSGYFLGKHKLIPHVSPKKTVEGAIGGILGSVVVSIAYLAITKNIMNIDYMNLWTNIYVQGAVIGLVGGSCSQIGDLAASAIKRDADIKDFGKIFPGHGGFMDRFDSVMFIAPLILGVMCAIALF